MNKKLILMCVFALGVAAFFFFDLGRFLSLESLKTHRDELLTFYEANPLVTILGFIGIYIATTALSLPGATLLTLLGGALFGAVKGTFIVNIGASCGATLAFLAARFLLKDWVQSKFGEKLKAFQAGFEENAFNYMLFLRLVPLFPFFLVNLASGITRIPVRTFFFGTMIGTLPGTFVYANAGSNLASINSLKDIASPQVLGAFILLGLFALVPTLYQKFKNRKSQSSPA